MRKWILLATVLLLASSAASAQIGKRFELTPSVGYRWLGDFDVQDVEFLDNNLEVDQSVAYGLALDIPLTDWMQLELMVNRQDSELLADGGLFSDERSIADVVVSYYQVGVLWQWGSGQAQPFVSATAGIANIEIDLPRVQEEDRFAATLGGGVKVFLNRNVGLRVEGRGYWVDLNENNNDDRWENESSLVQADVSLGLILAW